eukprot:TRINITY_DN2960_c1_g1_i2.p1 TRINITY_DN2960_c1_g1~~TRINITY_DN2960_c1_g1_i2.p1  ORF type:complete len:201 (+),score=-12.23 TRINITY_DN2960_c1_g1_i2:19-621(+)
MILTVFQYSDIFLSSITSQQQRKNNKSITQNGRVLTSSFHIHPDNYKLSPKIQQSTNFTLYQTKKVIYFSKHIQITNTQAINHNSFIKYILLQPTATKMITQQYHFKQYYEYICKYIYTMYIQYTIPHYDGYMIIYGCYIIITINTSRMVFQRRNFQKNAGKAFSLSETECKERTNIQTVFYIFINYTILQQMCIYFKII